MCVGFLLLFVSLHSNGAKAITPWGEMPQTDLFFKFKFQECIFSFLLKFILYLNTRFTRVIPDQYATFVNSNVANTETFSKMCGIFPRMAMYARVCVCVYIYIYIHTYTQVSLVKNQNLTHWKLMGDSMTVLPPVSLPSILPLPLSHCTSSPARKKFGTCLKNVISLFFFYVEDLVSLKLHNLNLCTSGSFYTALVNVHNKLNEYDTDIHNRHRTKNLNFYNFNQLHV
jgi:hypothetical protein